MYQELIWVLLIIVIISRNLHSFINHTDSDTIFYITHFYFYSFTTHFFKCIQVNTVINTKHKKTYLSIRFTNITINVTLKARFNASGTHSIKMCNYYVFFKCLRETKIRWKIFKTKLPYLENNYFANRKISFTVYYQKSLSRTLNILWKYISYFFVTIIRNN